MSKARVLPAWFWDDPDVGQLTFPERHLLAGMITRCADDKGRLRADPGYLRKEIFGYDEGITRDDVATMLGRIFAQYSRALLYTAAGQQFIFLMDFEEEQKIKYIVASKLPPPPIGEIFPKLEKIGKAVEKSSVEKSSVEREESSDGESAANSLSLASASQDTTATQDQPLDDAQFVEQQAAFEAAYPTRFGRRHNFGKARKLLRVLPAREWPLLLTATRNYAAGDLARDGPTHNPENFVAHEWRAWLTPAAPQTNGANGHGRTATAIDDNLAPAGGAPTAEDFERAQRDAKERISRTLSRHRGVGTRQPGAA